MRIVIAIGGNAIIAEHERGTWAEQQANAAAVAAQLATLRADGHEIVLTHGNGPHVGALHTQHAHTRADVPALPFDALVAMTQGQLGYLLQTAIEQADPQLPTATVLTRVRVDAHDSSFVRPTKPIGRFFADERAARAAVSGQLAVAPDAGRGWRAVVPSPKPQQIVDVSAIKLLLDRGMVVIAAGGGGIPVARGKRSLVGQQAVIDKDRASAVLAQAVDADLLVMLTAVECVAVDFGTRWQRDMARLTISDARELHASGEFPAGSMGPKVESAITFVQGGGRGAIVTCAERLRDAIRGTAGTRLVPDAQGPSATVWSGAGTVAA